MKNLHKLVGVCIAMLIAYGTTAQVQSSAKPYMFRNSAEKLPTNVTELDKAFTAKEGTKIKLKFDSFVFTGVITSSIKRYDNLYSVIVQSSTGDNTLLSISKRINDDKTISYVGRILNEKYADGYELSKDKNGKYAMHKIKSEILIQDY